MTAIYKRELKSYLTSMVGYLFIFFILVLTGIYFSAYQLSAAYPKFEYTLSAITFAFLIGVPILTMRVLAEERKQKTDQLLLTAPVSVEKIVLGKYFALVTIFAIPMLIMCLYPLLMTKFGTVSLGAAYTAILGFFLLGCANLAIGVFISSLTESQVIAAVLTFVILFAFYMMNGIYYEGRKSAGRGSRNWRCKECGACDSGSSDHNLYNDQKLPDLSSHLCSWGDRTCHCLCCKFQLFLRWNPENSGYLQPEQPF